jgi:hypothetical protein
LGKGSAASLTLAVEPSTAEEPPSYGKALRALGDSGVPFLVGGALVVAAYCGIRRTTKDLDIFVFPQDVARTLDVLWTAGFCTEQPFPHWLAKARAGEHHVDVIFNSGNGAAPVDADWFAYAPATRVWGVAVRMCPVEETIWSKAFVMERERFDGADVAHLLLSCASWLNWTRLLGRFGEHWRVLFAHLVLFAYIFPSAAEQIPTWVMRELTNRLRPDTTPSRSSRLCRGTLLSREQYLGDLERGWLDGRLPPNGSMSQQEVAIWTAAIERRER